MEFEDLEGVVSFSNLDKVLYPRTGFTKGDVIRYYVGDRAVHAART